jgi:hypothetical protein
MAPTGRGEYIAGYYTVQADQVRLISQPTTTVPPLPGPNYITLLAVGMGVDGLVAIRGSQGVRITAGPPLPVLPAESPVTNGIEIQTGPEGLIRVQRGVLPTDQSVLMTPAGIVIDAGIGMIRLNSLTEITLSVAEGASQITLRPDGITLMGMEIKHLAEVQMEIITMLHKLTAEMNQVTSALHQFM